MGDEEVWERGPAEQVEQLELEEDDDFGGFDDFAEFETGRDEVEPDTKPELSNAEIDDVAHSKAEDTPPYEPVAVLRSADIGPGIEDAVRERLTAPPSVHDSPDGDGGTPTSQQLWHVLTEPSWVPVPHWNGSRIHKRLAVSLGVPLNLDESLPKVATRHMVLPTTSEESVEGMQKVPEWNLLALVSPEAVQSMTTDELLAHTATLTQAISSAEALKDALESQEMDLLGEKNILEGMVESLLAYSQRNQRESIRRRASKSKR